MMFDIDTIYNFIKDYNKEMLVGAGVTVIVYLLYKNLYPSETATDCDIKMYKDMSTQTDFVYCSYLPEQPVSSVLNVDISFSYQALVKEIVQMTQSISHSLDIFKQCPTRIDALGYISEIQYQLQHFESDVLFNAKNIQLLIDAAQLVD